MAYMQLSYTNESSRLTPEEAMHIRSAATATEQEIVAAANALQRMVEANEGMEDFRQVLDRLTSCVNATPIPKRFIADARAPFVASASTRQHERAFYHETHNRSYVRRLRRQRCRQRKVSVLEDHYFQIPTTPLPLSYAAQQDLEMARDSQGSRRRGPTGSGYAPLFSKANSTQPSREMTPAETAALKFLTPPERSPLALTLEKMQAQPRYTPSDPQARQRFNEPKQMPNLNRRVRRSFVASCVQQHTCAYANRCEGNGERHARNSTLVKRAGWH